MRTRANGLLNTRATNAAALLSLFLSLALPATSLAGELAVGRHVVLKSLDVPVINGARVTLPGTSYPKFRVVRIEGDWARVASRSFHGWVRQSDLISLERAIAELSRAVEREPKIARALVPRGLVFMMFHQWEAALADFDKAVSLDPNWASARVARAFLHDERKDHDRAIADLDDAIRIAPADAEAYASRGEIRYAQRDYKRAIADFHHAIRIRPDFAQIRVSRSLARLGEYGLNSFPDNAQGGGGKHFSTDPSDIGSIVAEINTAITLDPECTMTLGAAAYVLMITGNVDESLAELNKAISRDPGEPWLYVRRGTFWQFR